MARIMWTVASVCSTPSPLAAGVQCRLMFAACRLESETQRRNDRVTYGESQRRTNKNALRRHKMVIVYHEFRKKSN